MTDQLSEAIVVYIGRGEEKYPASRSGHLVREFGVHAPGLQRQIDRLVQEIGSIPYPEGADTPTAYRWVLEEVGRRHPELSAEAVEALSWQWSWQNR